MSVTRCGFIALIGKPNVGKSTLINQVLKEKISIISHRPQTTRHQIYGIQTIENCQMIYVDTPGIHCQEKVSAKKINQYMNKAAISALHDVDLIIFIVEAGIFVDEDKDVLSMIKNAKLPVILVINKIDRIKQKDSLLPFIEKMSKEHDFKEIIPLSALSGKQVDIFQKQVIPFCPEGPFHFSEETICNRNDNFRLAELVYEKMMWSLNQEVPYAATVQIEAVKHLEKVIEIYALIWVEKIGQKSIVIGNKGSMLKTIGTQARYDMEKLLGKKVMLKLWVKVKDGWSNNTRDLAECGLHL